MLFCIIICGVSVISDYPYSVHSKVKDIPVFAILLIGLQPRFLQYHHLLMEHLALESKNTILQHSQGTTTTLLCSNTEGQANPGV